MVSPAKMLRNMFDSNILIAEERVAIRDKWSRFRIPIGSKSVRRPVRLFGFRG